MAATLKKLVASPETRMLEIEEHLNIYVTLYRKQNRKYLLKNVDIEINEDEMGKINRIGGLSIKIADINDLPYIQTTSEVKTSYDKAARLCYSLSVKQKTDRLQAQKKLHEILHSEYIILSQKLKIRNESSSENPHDTETVNEIPEEFTNLNSPIKNKPHDETIHTSIEPNVFTNEHNHQDSPFSEQHDKNTNSNQESEEETSDDENIEEKYLMRLADLRSEEMKNKKKISILKHKIEESDSSSYTKLQLELEEVYSEINSMKSRNSKLTQQVSNLKRALGNPASSPKESASLDTQIDKLDERMSKLVRRLTVNH